MNPQVEILERIMEKEIKITIPEGYEIDKENSTFDDIFQKSDSDCVKDFVPDDFPMKI